MLRKGGIVGKQNLSEVSPGAGSSGDRKYGKWGAERCGYFRLSWRNFRHDVANLSGPHSHIRDCRDSGHLNSSFFHFL